MNFFRLNQNQIIDVDVVVDGALRTSGIRYCTPGTGSTVWKRPTGGWIFVRQASNKQSPIPSDLRSREFQVRKWVIDGNQNVKTNAS